MSKSKANRGRSQSRAQGNHQSESAAKAPTNLPSNNGRRKFLAAAGIGGAGALAAAGIAGYFYKTGGKGATSTTPGTVTPSLASGKPLPPVTLPADYQNALRAADEIVSHYSRELNSPTTLIHSVRAFGKNFTLNDGSKAIDYICQRFGADRDVNGKRYVFFPREHETHDNSFLKTMLEAGVSPEHPITAGGARYTLRDLGESASALFRCDPQNLARYDAGLIHQHLPWGLIAFSILIPPSKAVWTNAYGEKIDLSETINSSLAVFESTCAGVGEAVARGENEPVEFRKGIGKYSCDGMHLVYGFFSCLEHGYTNNKLPDRLNKLLDSVLYRMKGDALATDREAAESSRNVTPEQLRRIAAQEEGGRIVSKGPPPPNWIEMERIRVQIRMLGHAMEAINYGRLHKLFTLTTDQQARLRAGEQALYEFLVKMRTIDLDAFKRWYPEIGRQCSHRCRPRVASAETVDARQPGYHGRLNARL